MKDLEKVELLSLIDWLKQRDYVYYHAPMDTRAYTLHVISYTINNDKPELSSVRLKGPELTFTAKLTEHLDRFRLPVHKNLLNLTVA